MEIKMNKLEYTIKDTEEIQEIQTKEEFKRDCYKTPLLTCYLQITFECAGLEFKAKTFKVSKRLSIYGLKFRDWLEKNYPENPEPTYDRILQALSETKNQVRVLKGKDGRQKSSRTEFLFDPRYYQKNETTTKLFKMIQEEINSTTPDIFVQNIYDKKVTDVRDYLNAYLYKHAYGWTIYNFNEDISTDYVVYEYLKNLLFEVYLAKVNCIYDLNTPSSIIDLLEYMDVDESKYQVKEIIDTMDKGYKLWDLLPVDTIIKVIEDTEEYQDGAIDLSEIHTVKRGKKCN